MDTSQIRKRFFEFFGAREHSIVKSAPMVLKNDPTLMFTNAGMNQFKDYFLGHQGANHVRIANTQKCLRVSGKHNDLEEVGVDTYHHTMFEMLGNWSFGDYFKQEAIQWAYELLVDEYGIDKELLYVTYFNGDASDKLNPDQETRKIWLNYFPEERILGFGKKDNFWEMGETGPCGPCSEIHIDLRTREKKLEKPGAELVNASHPEVIEIWNLVFMEFNRSKDLSLKSLPNKHVDTGMGLERLAMVLQEKKSSYDTDLFAPLIEKLEEIFGNIKYGQVSEKDIAFRVVVDHVRAVSISIAEGQLPFNTGAGYVIRRILRRAIRYAYSFLSVREPIIYQLVPIIVEILGETFEELSAQSELIQKVIREEEENFLKTLENGIARFEEYIKSNPEIRQVDGKFVFELYDTFGFPFDLTQLLARERGIEQGIDELTFREELTKQKERSRQATKIDAEDWVVLMDDQEEEFIGFDRLETEVRIVKYREVHVKNKVQFQLVFNLTPFYPEGGGQIGDTGILSDGKKEVKVLNTLKENNLIVHIVDQLPVQLEETFTARVDVTRREDTRRNHSATHLLHRVLREALGDHVEQKGSLVHPDYLRFDFSHFEKISPEQLNRIESEVNKRITGGFALEENRSMPYQEARNMGAMALFGEKYADVVRVVKFGNSIELCGGTHVENTAEIGHFRILSEGSVSAGIRRIEAITGRASDEFIEAQLKQLGAIHQLLKNPKNVVEAVERLMGENKELQLKLDSVRKSHVQKVARELNDSIQTLNGIKFLSSEVDLNADEMRDVVFKLKSGNKDLFVVLANGKGEKVVVSVGIGEGIGKQFGWSAKDFVKEISPFIKGGGGGQENFATAGGKDANGISKVFSLAEEKIKKEAS